MAWTVGVGRAHRHDDEAFQSCCARGRREVSGRINDSAGDRVRKIASSGSFECGNETPAITKIPNHDFCPTLFQRCCSVVSLPNQRADRYAQPEQLSRYMCTCSAVTASAADHKDGI